MSIRITIRPSDDGHVAVHRKTGGEFLANLTDVLFEEATITKDHKALHIDQDGKPIRVVEFRNKRGKVKVTVKTLGDSLVLRTVNAEQATFEDIGPDGGGG